MFLITTTGVSPSTVILYDLGERTFYHPTTNYDLESEFTIEEIYNSLDLFASITGGSLTAVYDGVAVESRPDVESVRSDDNRLFTEKEIRVKKNPGIGEFSSIAAAIATIIDSNIYKYIIKIGPGVYIEPELFPPTNVSVEGSAISATIVEPDGNHNVFTLTDVLIELSFLTINNAPVGYAGIYVNDCGDYTQAHKVSFNDCDTNILVYSSTKDTVFYGEYIDFNGVYSYGLKTVATNGFRAFSNMENYYNIPALTSPSPNPIGTYLSGVGAQSKIHAGSNLGVGTGTSFYLQDGSLLHVSATDISGFHTGIHIANSGVFPEFEGTSILSKASVYDLLVEHPGAIGTFQGTADMDKIFIDVASSLSITINHIAEGSLNISKKLNIRFPNGTSADVSTLIIESGTMGVMEGGELTAAGSPAFVLDIADGFGYLEQFPDQDFLKRVDWLSTSIVLAPNTNNYIFFNYNGILTVDSTEPDTFFNILLGRAVTNSTGIEFIDATPLSAEHNGNRLSDAWRNGIGCIFDSGSFVSEHTTESPSLPFHLDVSSGIYYFAENKFSPSGGFDINFVEFYKNGIGGFVRTLTNVVDGTHYDNGTGTLQPLSSGHYTKHSLYLVGEGSNEKYFLIVGQEQFSALALAEQGNVPVPPTTFDEGVVLIAAIIVKQGIGNIAEIQDVRPIIGFRAPTVSATTFHGNLLGLNNDDHPQYLLVNGSRAMTGNLNLGGNDIANVGLVDGVNVPSHASRHLPNGADPLTTATAISVDGSNAEGIANSFARSDHQHTIASNTVTDAMIATHTSTKITITTKGQLNSAIVYNDQANTYGDFNQIFRSSRLIISNPANNFNYTFVGSAIVAPRNITIPLLTGDDTFVTEAFVQALTNKTGYNGLVVTANTGVITTGTWNGTTIAANRGGTGQSVYAIGDLLYADTTTTLAKLADVAAGSYLRSGGVSTAPVWSTLVIPNAATTGDILFASATNTITSLADVATGNAIISGGVGVIPSYGKIGLATHISGILAGANGGTGVANTGFTITLAGNITTTGAFNTTFAQQFSGTITLPNATSTLATLALTENFSNKTLDNTNTITLKDTLFTVQDDGDTSKQMKFQLSGITTATTRTMTVPDADGTIVIRDAVYENTLTTTNNTVTTITTIPTSSNTAYLVEVMAVSRRVSGTGAGVNGDSSAYVRTAKYKNVAGTVTIGTVQSSYTDEDIAAHNITLTVSGTNVLVQVAGSTNNTVDWKSISDVISVS